MAILLVLYLTGYQPILAIPPLKKTIALASFAQEQNIQASSFSESFILPHPGYLTSKFTSFHPGVDIATGLGMPVHPIIKGKVVDAIYNFWGLGHYVIVEHEQGIRSTYGHMGRIFVKKGDEVKTGSFLGEVGMTGWTSGPHTHLEVSKDGKYIDPETLLPKIPNWESYVKSMRPAVTPGVGGR